MKVATVTPVYNSEFFLRPFLKQISVFDENIILLGKAPFEDYLQAGLVQLEPDKSREILKEFPKLHIIEHDIKFYSGELFNLGLKVAKELGCDAILKIDPDMFLTQESLEILLDKLNSNFETLSLNMQTNTMVYEEDFDHGVTQGLWNVGQEPMVIRTDHQFAEDGTNIHVDGHQELMYWPNFMIHHFSGFKRKIISQVEQMPNFPGWTPCPQEIRDKF